METYEHPDGTVVASTRKGTRVLRVVGRGRTGAVDELRKCLEFIRQAEHRAARRARERERGLWRAVRALVLTR